VTRPDPRVASARPPLGRWPSLALLAVLALVGAGCGLVSPAGDDAITVHAEFDDVLDLVTGAHVRAGDVPIGTVTDIELTDDLRGRVEMRIDADTGLPAETAAWLAKTSMLGERYVDLRPVGDSGRLTDGQELTETRVLSDFEDLVQAGSDVLAYVAAESIAGAVETGARAFGGRGGQLGRFITDVESFVGRYEEGSDDLLRLIDELDALTAAVAADAELNAEGIAVLERASRVLEEEDERLLDALSELERLSTVGDRLMREHRREIDDTVRRIRITLEQVTRIEGALENLLYHAPQHNIHVPNGITDEFAQVWLDFIVCGMQDADGDPSRDCTPPNTGEHADPPPYQPSSEACNRDHAHCDGTQRDEAQ
jgi:phospholipid/cholesterol/gamma-HCH transport system substrate-binding protein